MGVGIKGSPSGNPVEATTGNRLQVALPTAAEFVDDPGHASVSFLTGSRVQSSRVSENGELYTADGEVLAAHSFNGAAANIIVNNKFNQQATTMTTAVNAGFCRFNAGLVTTINIGASLNSWQVFSLERGVALSVKNTIRHTNGALANKVFEFGLGYYLVAANQGNVPNEFVGFRWTSSGSLIGVLEYSTGSTAVSLTVNINGGVPLSDGVAREYEVLIKQNRVEFWINGVYYAEIEMQPDASGILKSSGYPLFFRQYHVGSVPSAAPVLEIGNGSVTRFGPDADISPNLKYSASGAHCSGNQHGLITTNGVTMSNPASGSAPAAVTVTNATTAIATLGGLFRINGVAITATNQTNYLISSYLNPALPTAIGALNDARQLVITDLNISPLIVAVVLAGGGVSLEWFVAIGATSSTLAATDGIGTTNPGTKQPRFIHLGLLDSFAAAAAAGVVSTRVGNSSFNFTTPLVIQPGEYFMVGFRTLFVNAAISSGELVGAIGVNGFWM